MANKLLGGNVPKGKGGSRPLDHPGCDSMPGSVNNIRGISANALFGGKAHPSVGGKISRVKQPPMNTYATPGGKRTKVEKTTW